MKKYIFIILIICSLPFVSNSQTQEAAPLGIVSYLSFVKGVAEGKVRPCVERVSLTPTFTERFTETTTGASATTVTKETTRTLVNPATDDDYAMISHYIVIKIITDGIIEQLKADMIKSNSICIFNKIDKVFKGKNLNGKVSLYRTALDNLQHNPAYTSIFTSNNKRALEAGDMLSFITEGIGKGMDMAKLIQENKKVKVDGVIAILDKLKLADITSFRSTESETKK